MFSQQRPDGEIRPRGFIHLERFRLEGSTTVWTFALAEALLEKRIWMQPGANTTYIRYDLLRASEPVELALRSLVNDRDHHEQTRAEDIQVQVERVEKGLRVSSPEGIPFYLLGEGIDVTVEPAWQLDHFLSVETYRGLPAVEDHFSPGLFRARLQPGGSLTLVASTQPDPVLGGRVAYQERQAYERSLIERSGRGGAPGWLQQLVLAADQFIVLRELPDKPVEVNALWYNALISLAGFAERLDEPGGEYRQLASQARAGFQRIWNPAAGYCYDIIDGPEGPDPSLRQAAAHLSRATTAFTVGTGGRAMQPTTRAQCGAG